MSALTTRLTRARAHILGLALIALPLVVAACNKGSGGNGY
jgi:hypothetical protein